MATLAVYVVWWHASSTAYESLWGGAHAPHLVQSCGPVALWYSRDPFETKDLLVLIYGPILYFSFGGIGYTIVTQR